MPKIVIPYTPRYPDLHRQLAQYRFFALVAHRRFGKTVVAVNHLIRAAITSTKRNSHFAYLAPFRTQAKTVAWDYLKHYTKNIESRKINEGELSITLPQSRNAKIRIFGADNPNSLRGLYFDGVVLDEVAQMKPEVWEEIIQPALADRQGFAVFIGTPNGINLFSQIYFYAVEEQARGSKIWGAACHPVDTTTALPAEEVERLRAELSDSKFRQEMLCDFTASSDDILITLDEVDAACKRVPDHNLAREWPLVVGVDVARFGEDASVFFPRRGPVAFAPRIYRKKSNVEIARLLVSMIEEQKPEHVCIDQGQGTGVIDLVKDLSPGTAIVEVPFGSQAMDGKRYVNRRAEMWTLMRDWLRGGACLDIADPAALKAELTAPTYSFDAHGRIKLEAKEEIKKRLKHSTDIGDALALTFAIKTHRIANEHYTDFHSYRRREAEYDPFGVD